MSGESCVVERKRPLRLLVAALLWLAWMAFLAWIAFDGRNRQQESAADLPTRLKAGTISGFRNA